MTERTERERSRARHARFVERWRKDPASIEAERLAEGAPPPPPRDARAMRRRYRDWLWPRRRALLGVAGLGVASIGFDLAWPLVSKYLIDDVVLDASRPLSERQFELLATAALMLAVFLLASLANFWRNLRMTLLGARLAFDLRVRLFDRILRLPLEQVQAMKTGGVLSRLSTDVDSTTDLVHNALLAPMLSALRLLATLAVMFVLEWRLALAAVVVMPLIMLLHHRSIRRVRPIWRAIGADRQDIDARTGEAISGLRVVRGFARERGELRTYAVGLHTVIRKRVLAARIQGTVNLIWGLMMPAANLTVIGFGGWLVMSGVTTIGTLMALQSYFWRLLEPVMQIVNSISETQRGLAAMERVFDVLDRAPEKPDRPGALPAPRTVHELRFEGVSFAYPQGRQALTDIDLVVRGGTTVALVGPSGAGKTTLTDLVARFHDPTAGRITLDGIDLRDLRLSGYRRLLGIVQQETFLFDGSVRDNIRYARPSARSAEVEDAARRANADAFIRELPQGYDTWIGERGVKLSGGQRQRIAIARALLADPAILILDEATSNLDTESERLIQESLRELLRGRTTFVIAHRLSTIAEADQILVLEKGRIVERGTHAELLARGGRYRRMVELQAKGVLDPWAALDD
ncbi:MAG TPA: ABC transporter ATP-binding protein [Planctomycetota bacterium]|nr:ABC transporter ATP-binding protein [Planctomycetota bacterium]